MFREEIASKYDEKLNLIEKENEEHRDRYKKLQKNMKLLKYLLKNR